MSPLIAAAASILVFCAPGYPGSSTDAQPLVGEFATSLAAAAGWPAGSLSAVYDANEQSDLVLEVCGYIKTTASGSIALGLYADAGISVTSGNLLHKTASAVTQNSASAPFSIRAVFRYDSVSGKLTGECKQSINNTVDGTLGSNAA